MTFRPTPDRLIPELDARQELVLLARALWREGFDDHLAGHITVNLGDGTMLCNPWLLTWDELLPEHVIRIDMNGELVDGEWPVPLGIPLHLALHRARPDVQWAMHNHPRYSTAWADMGEVPPAMDQSGTLGGGGAVHCVDEYRGGVNNAESAAAAIDGMGDSEMALLAGHGVFVLGGSARSVYQRGVALEARCRRAWQIRAAGGALDSKLPAAFVEAMQGSDGEGFIGFWEAAVRAELRAEPTLLQRSSS